MSLFDKYLLCYFVVHEFTVIALFGVDAIVYDGAIMRNKKKTSAALFVSFVLMFAIALIGLVMRRNN